MRFLKGQISERIEPGPPDLSCFRTYVPLVPEVLMTAHDEFQRFEIEILKNEKSEIKKKFKIMEALYKEAVALVCVSF